MKAIFERAELLKRTKKFRNELNVAETIADEFGLSRSTINNYLTLKKLCPEAKTLVSKKELNLNSAKEIAKFNEKDQLYILEHTKLENLNEGFKVKLLAKDIDLNAPSQKALDDKIETLERVVPNTTTVNVEIAKDKLEKFLNVVINFKKEELASFSRLKDRKYIKKTIRVSLNERDMKLYASKGIIDEALVKKAVTCDYMEIIRA